MWKHYLKTALRALIRQKSYAVINILGLSTGIACFILILLFLQNELSYERHIPDSADIYRLVEIQRPAGIDIQHVAITAGPWAPELRENLPQVRDALRMMGAWGRVFHAEDKIFRENYAYYAESSIFHMFAVNLLEGSPEGALDLPNTAVISESVAMRFFGITDVIGKTFRFGDVPYQITGLMEDIRHNSHLQFNILLSYPTLESEIPQLREWGQNYLTTFIMLQPGHSRKAAEENMRSLTDVRMNELGLQDIPRPEMYLQPLRDIYLHSGNIKFSVYNHKGDINRVYVLSAVAMLILLIACVNFINLSTARAGKRSLEVGMRKVMGAGPGNLVAQFLSESVLVTFFGLIVSIGLVELFLPEFNTLLGTQLFIDFKGNWVFNIGLLGLLVFVGFIAGIYPALYLSRFKPIRAIRERSQGVGTTAGKLRKILVVFQFAISAMLVFSTMVIYNQWTYLKNKDIGIDYDNVVYMRVLRGAMEDRVFRNIRHEFMQHPSITGAAASSGYNGVSGSQGSVVFSDSTDVELMVRYGFVDENFFSVMGVDVVQGEIFTRPYGENGELAVVLNQAALRALNWENVAGRRFRSPNPEQGDIVIAGVIKDYNYFALRQSVEPALYLYDPGMFNTLVVRYLPGKEQQALDHIEKVWTGFFPELPFEPLYAQETARLSYAGEANAMRVISFFAIFCIIISALGLYGLSAFVAEQKQKEIGVRKVLGGTSANIVFMLQREFLRLILIALLVAYPLVWFAMDRWLSNYAYRISLSIWHFAITTLVVFAIGFFTVLFHAWKAASANPVDAMKCE